MSYTEDSYQTSEVSEEENLDEISTEIPDDFWNQRYMYKKEVRNNGQGKVKCDIVIKQTTDVKRTIAYCIDLMFNKQYPYVKLTALSQNIDKAFFIGELLKRKVKNLHQVTELKTFKFIEIYTPKEQYQDRERFKIEKLSTLVEIQLTRNKPKDVKHYGYQEPLQLNLVSTRDPRDYIKYVLEESRQPKKKEIVHKTKQRIQ